MVTEIVLMDWQKRMIEDIKKENPDLEVNDSYKPPESDD